MTENTLIIDEQEAFQLINMICRLERTDVDNIVRDLVAYSDEIDENNNRQVNKMTPTQERIIERIKDKFFHLNCCNCPDEYEIYDIVNHC